VSLKCVLCDGVSLPLGVVPGICEFPRVLLSIGRIGLTLLSFPLRPPVRPQLLPHQPQCRDQDQRPRRVDRQIDHHIRRRDFLRCVPGYPAAGVNFCRRPAQDLDIVTTLQQFPDERFADETGPASDYDFGHDLLAVQHKSPA